MTTLHVGWPLLALGLALGCGGSTDTGTGSQSSGGTGGASTGGTSSGGSATAGSSAGGTSSGGVSSGGTSSGGTSTGGASTGGTGGAAGGPIDPPAPPHCGGKLCANGEACCMATSACFDPLQTPGACATPPPDGDPEGRTPCSSNAHCPAGYFCMADDAELCQVNGHCQPISNCGTCSGGGDSCKVCGCDGNTYPDVQTACRAGANALPYNGAGCGETLLVGAGGSSAGKELTPCGADAQCPASELCCAITGLCYPASDPARCALPPPGTSFPCTANDQCWSGEYCAGAGCAGPGGCVSTGHLGQCGVTLEPVCGCDHVTYTSAACADQTGVRVAAPGECP